MQHKAIAYARQYPAQYQAELIEFLKIPSISAKPKHAADVHDAANWLANNMRVAGLENVNLITTDGHPLIYADWLHAKDAPTVLFYGHFDVQPAEPIDLWESDPFTPQIKDDYIYARGCSDDKGQTLILIKAIEAYLQSVGSLPINVKFIMEGEEESGGEQIEAFIPNNKNLLAADVAWISDTHMPAPNHPSIVYGLRGMAYLLIDITGPSHDLHSGSMGGGVDNPIHALAHIISQLKAQDGTITIPGFYDDVRLLEQEERARLANSPQSEDEYLANAGAPTLWGEKAFTLTERLGARPTLDFNGIVGGYIGDGPKTIIPSTVHAKLSMRLVPDQDPERISQLVTDYIKQICPDTVSITITPLHGAAASISDYNHPAMQAAALAATTVFGNEPVYKREGGSIPIVGQLKRDLNMETILLGFGLPDDRIHSPNERFYLPHFFQGIETVIHFLANYSNM